MENCAIVAGSDLKSDSGNDCTDRSKLWEDYARKYNYLSKQIVKAGIDINLLQDVINAAKQLG